MGETPEISSASRAAQVRRVVWVEMLLNIVVATAKTVYAVWAGSLAVASDALHSFLDAGANIIGLVALKMAEEPPDPEHPYGHRKFEIIAAAAIGVVIAGGVVQFGRTAIEAILEGRVAMEAPLAGFFVVGGTLVVNIFVAIYEAKRGRELQSAFLIADAGHTASDVVVTLGVLGSLVASRYGVGWADAAAALFVLVIVARVAWEILTHNVGVLVDRVVVDADQVRAIARAVEGVAEVHRVRSRGTDLFAYIDLHLLLDPELSLRRAHEIAHRVEDALHRELPQTVDVTIHMEPDDDGHEDL